MVISFVIRAQSDTGGGAVLFASTLGQGKQQYREEVAFSAISTPGTGISVFHSDRTSAEANVFFGVAYLRRSFNVDYGSSGLGGGYTTSARVDMDMLYFSCGPEFRAAKSGKLSFRFGPLIGIHAGGTMSGVTQGWSIGTNGSRTYFQGEEPTMFQCDLRLMFGFSHRAMLNETIGWNIDPGLHFALSSMMEDYRTRGVDLVISVGLFWRSSRSLIPRM